MQPNYSKISDAERKKILSGIKKSLDNLEESSLSASQDREYSLVEKNIRQRQNSDQNSATSNPIPHGLNSSLSEQREGSSNSNSNQHLIRAEGENSYCLYGPTQENIEQTSDQHILKSKGLLDSQKIEQPPINKQNFGEGAGGSGGKGTEGRSVDGIKQTSGTYNKENSNNLEQTPNNPSGAEDDFDTYLESLGTNSQQFFPLSFLENPLELYSFFDDNVQRGRIEFYDWQKDVGIFFGSRGLFTKEYPLWFHLCACNGSGKDAYVIAPFAVWFCITKIRSRCIITSSSFQQLNTQTEAYIRALCNKINIKLIELGICNSKAFLIKKQHIVCTLTGSEIKLFATDEEGKAEGFHPYPDDPDSEMAIIINEAKSIPLEIFRALNRCTGYNYWLEISSPGIESGDFYDHCTKAVKYPAPYVRGKRYFRRVTALECKHISKVEIEQRAAELPVELFNSIYMAMFTSVGQQLVITYDAYNKLKEADVPHEKGERAGGLDLSLGGDETVFIPRDGNMQTGMECSRIRETMALCEWLENVFWKYGFEKSKPSGSLGTPIYTDFGGLGKPIAHILMNRFWNLVACYNNSPAVRKNLYVNRGTEGMFHLGNLINRKTIIISDDVVLKTQLCTREFSYNAGMKIKLKSKEDMKASGQSSPDRSDALELCFSFFQPSILKAEANDRYGGENKKDSLTHVSQRELVSKLDNQKFSGFGTGFVDNRLGFNRSSRISQKGLIEEALGYINKEGN